MNWGKSIVLIFIVFAGFIGTLVFLMTRQKVDLVREEYYQNELAYQRQIDRAARTIRLRKSVTLLYQPARQQVAFVHSDSIQTAELTFYRPSDRRQDVQLKLNPNGNPIPPVSTARLAKGYWKVQITWSDGRQDYFTEKALVIQ